MGATFAAVELFILEDWDWLSGLPFVTNLAVRSAIYAAIIIGIIMVVGSV